MGSAEEKERSCGTRATPGGLLRPAPRPGGLREGSRGGEAPMGRRREPGRAVGPGGAASCQRGIPGSASGSSPMCP